MESPMDYSLDTSTISVSIASTTTLGSESRICHPDQDRTDQSLDSFQSPRSSMTSSSASSESDPFSSENGNATQTQSENESFVRKVARFECLSESHNNNHHNRRCYDPKSYNAPTLRSQESRHDHATSDDDGCVYTKKVLTRPNINFNRSDQGFQSDYISVYSAPSSCVVASSRNNSNNPRVSISPKKNGHGHDDESSHYASVNNNSINNNNSISTTHNDSTFNGKYTTPTSPYGPNSHQIPSKSKMNLNLNMCAIPPQNPHYFDNGSGPQVVTNGNGSPAQQVQSAEVNGDHQNDGIDCETLLQLNRKQVETSRAVSEAEMSKQDALGLDEILAICEEYQRQIAEELSQKRDVPHSGKLSNGNGYGMEIGVQKPFFSSSPQNEGLTQMKTSNYARVKTNGSLPRDSSSTSPLFHRPHISFADEVVADSANPNKSLYSNTSVIRSPKDKDVNNEESVSTCPSSRNTAFKSHSTSALLSQNHRTSQYENMTTTGEAVEVVHNNGHFLSHFSSTPRLGYGTKPGAMMLSGSGVTNGRAMPENENIERFDCQFVDRVANNGLPSSLQSPHTQDQQNLNFAPTLSTTNSGSAAYNRSTEKTYRETFQEKVGQPVNNKPLATTKSKLSVSFAKCMIEFGDDGKGKQQRVDNSSSLRSEQWDGDRSGSSSSDYFLRSNDASRQEESTQVRPNLFQTEVLIHKASIIEEEDRGVNNQADLCIDSASVVGRESSVCSASGNKEDINQLIQNPSSPSSSPWVSLNGSVATNGGAIITTNASRSNKDQQSTTLLDKSPTTPTSALVSNNNFSHKQSFESATSTPPASHLGEPFGIVKVEENKPSHTSASHILSPEQKLNAELKREVGEIEKQEMEAIREMEMEMGLLAGEAKSLEHQLSLENEELMGLRGRLLQIDDTNRRWNVEGMEEISELKAKLSSSEKELQRLERIHEEFTGSTEEELRLLERLKFQHELVESDRKAFEDAEFYHMEEEINRETQRDELSKLVGDKGKRVRERQVHLEKILGQRRSSLKSSTDEVQKLEKARQHILKQLRKLRESSSQAESSSEDFPDSSATNNLEVLETISDADDVSNLDLEEKLQDLSLLSSSMNDLLHIETIKSRSPIGFPSNGGPPMSPKTCQTLQQIERNREHHLNEKGVKMLEEERAVVRELQKRIQDAVRMEWEASKKAMKDGGESNTSNGNANPHHSIYSVGSEDSANTAFTTSSSTDSGSGSGENGQNSSTTPSISSAMGGGGKGQRSFDISQQMERRPEVVNEHEESYDLTCTSSSSIYDQGTDENDGGGTDIVFRDRNKAEITRNRPLTRYLPVREEDEEEFDLRAHIESAGHQLELCPQVLVSPTNAKGFLSKLGSRFHKWNKRWFVFDRERRMLLYYSDKNSEKKSKPKPKGGIHFGAIEEVYVDHLQSVKSPVPKLTFCVKTKGRVFYLCAPSPEVMRMWIDIIFTGAEGYKEFKCET